MKIEFDVTLNLDELKSAICEYIFNVTGVVSDKDTVTHVGISCDEATAHIVKEIR